jgi:tetratricopeptide (TPR) repeat protein
LGIDKEKILDTAQKYILKGQSKKAIKEYLKLIEADPQDKRVHLKLGDLYLKNEEEDKAIQEYLKVARLYGEEDLNFRAISIYKKILSINPKFIEAFRHIANLYLKEGLKGNARNYYQSILAIYPKDTDALKALEKMESSQLQNGESINTSSAAEPIISRHSHPTEKKSIMGTSELPSPPATGPSILSPGPGISNLDKDSEMHYHLGIAYKEMELFDYAISEFEIASLSSAMKFDSYIMLGNCYMEKGDYNKSIECYKISSEIQGLSNEKLAQLHFNLGLAYEANGMIPEAIETFNLVLKFDHSFTDAGEKIKRLQSYQK